ncbi:MAG: hypothetical protein HOV80_09155 [Polyangiaceae bacterium]|nr:hypothetical protein [Polyangiaceae bacterium]
MTMTHQRLGHLLVGSLLLSSGCFVDAVGLGSRDAQGGGGSAVGVGGGVDVTTTSSTSGGGEAAVGGGGSTSTGMGGEGGCTTGCEPTSSDRCVAAVVFDLPADATMTLSDTTAGASDDVTVMGIAGLSCPSDGPDLWVAIRATAPGAIQFSLTPAADPGWGSSREKASLQVRTGCDAASPGEVLACKPTDQAPIGQASTQVFARKDDVFYVGVDGRGNNDQGPFELEIQHWTCGNGVVDPFEQCDSGPNPSASCSGCLTTAGTTKCGGSDNDTLSFWNAATARCYIWETGLGDRNFFDARELCVERGGDLASFEAAGEQAAFDMAFSVAEAWVGIQDFERDGTYDWLAGGAFPGPWRPGEPNNGEAKPRCAFMLDDGALGNYAEDRACDDKLAELVCELRGANP